MAIRRSRTRETSRRPTGRDADETLALLEAIEASAPVGLAFVDTELRVVRVNPTLAEAGGSSVAELIGMPVAELIPDNGADVISTLRRVLETGRAATGHELVYHSEGSTGEARHWLTSFHPVSVADETRGIGIVALDITEYMPVRGDGAPRHDLQAADRHRRALLNRLVHAEEDERRRVAGEIHDDPLQILSVLTMNLDLVARQVDDPATLSDIADARQSARTAIASLRELIFTLHPPALDQQGLGAALEDQLEKMREESGVDFALENRLVDEPGEEIRSIAFRVAREALTNIRKHAHARHVEVSLGESAETLIVRITDDGDGFDSASIAPEQLGLTLMRERVELANGSIWIDSRPGDGTRIEYRLPLFAP